jgi:hypothetical protein
MGISLQSSNLTDHFIRHQNFLGVISPIATTSPELDRADATFSGQLLDSNGNVTFGNKVQIRSVNFPFHVLRHEAFRIKLAEFNPSLIPPGGSTPETPAQQLLRMDCTFLVERGLAAPGNPRAVSFRVTNPGLTDRFIRHRNFELWVDPPVPGLPIPGDPYNFDATFIVVDGLLPEEPDGGPH